MTSFLASLMAISFNFAPKGWALCNGQTMAINQNQALFALLGTTFGGNGQTTFLLPNLQGRSAMGMGSGHILGEVGGEESHTLIMSEMPAHTHLLGATSAAASTKDPTNGILAQAPMYTSPGNVNATMAPGTIATVGGSQPHENRSPFMTINWVIALQGIFPSRN